MKQDDILWKGLLEDIFDDFLMFFFPEYVDLFDFARGFEFLDKELEQIFPSEGENINHPRFADKLVKVFTKDGEEKWILVHVEIQGYNDPAFAKRMYTYFYRIQDKFNMPVTSIVIFTGTVKNAAPGEYRYSFMGTENIFRYNTYKVAEQNRAALAESNNPFAVVMLTALLALEKGRLSEQDIVPLKIELVKSLFKKSIPKKKIRVLMNFIRYYIHFDEPENAAKFETEIRVLTKNNELTMGLEELLLKRAENRGLEKGRTEGIQKGRAEGMEEKAFLFVKNLLATTDFGDERIADLAGVDVLFVQQMRKTITSQA